MLYVPAMVVMILVWLTWLESSTWLESDEGWIELALVVPKRVTKLGVATSSLLISVGIERLAAPELCRPADCRQACSQIFQS